MPAVPRLRRMMSLPLKNGWEMPQRCAAEALMKMGPKTRALVPPDMVQRVKEANSMFRGTAEYMADPTRPRQKEKKVTAPPN